MKAFLMALGCVFLTIGTGYAAEPPAALKRAVEAQIGRQLRDPYSAVYEYLYYGPLNVCGLVNAKNAFGAYVGNQRFYTIYVKDKSGNFDVTVAQVAQPNQDISTFCSY